MISISGLAKQFGPKLLFSEVSLELIAGQRYGLVGANGCGKSTFLRVLTGEESADEGQLILPAKLRLGVLEQDHFALEQESILEVARAGDREVVEAERELAQLALAQEEHPERLEEYSHRVAELSESIERVNGYTLSTRAKEVLTGLGIAPDKHLMPLSTLSGGFKLRVLLAKVLLSRPDVLLLDEPTNHLDILSIRWLEQFLKAYPGCALVISHDRGFLDQVATRVLDVDYGTITEYPGNYTQFLVAKAEARELLEASAERTEKLMAEKRAFVERFRAKATKAKQAQSRLKQLEKMESVEVQRSSRRSPMFRFEPEKQSGKDVLRVEGLCKSYGEKKVLENVGFLLRRGERLGVIGENGIGKSTLIKILAGVLAADQGQLEFGVNVKPGYFAQDHHELLHDAKMTPLNFVWDAVPQEATTTIRGQLGRMLFSGDEVEKSVTTLSGGEAARVIFARIQIEKPNVLLLDEPTNHLDLEAIEALAEALEKFEGTVIFVSHDRFFVSKVATRILALSREGCLDFPGNFEDYLARQGEDHLDKEAVSLKAKAEQKAQSIAPGPESGLSYEERKRRANRAKNLPKRRDELLAQIEKLEAEKQQILAQYGEPGFFESKSPAELTRLSEREKQLEQEVTEKMSEWEAIELELEELSANN